MFKTGLWAIMWGVAGLVGALVLSRGDTNPLPPQWIVIGLPLICALAGALAGVVALLLSKVLVLPFGAGLMTHILAGALAGSAAGALVLGILGGVSRAWLFGLAGGAITALILNWKPRR